tara:strand:+ start:668 stop:1228 length:561 start_codon:yes stop_codon:yes gene_type:complete
VATTPKKHTKNPEATQTGTADVGIAVIGTIGVIGTTGIGIAVIVTARIGIGTTTSPAKRKRVTRRPPTNGTTNRAAHAPRDRAAVVRGAGLDKTTTTPEPRNAETMLAMAITATKRPEAKTFTMTRQLLSVTSNLVMTGLVMKGNATTATTVMELPHVRVDAVAAEAAPVPMMTVATIAAKHAATA